MMTLKTWGAGMGLLAMVGCSGLSTVSYPLGDGKYHVMRTFSDPHALVSSPQRNWTEICVDETLKNCTVETSMETTWSTGYITGLAGPVIYGTAFGFGMDRIGRGLGKSGSTTTNFTQSDATAGAASNQTANPNIHIPAPKPPVHYGR